MKWDGYHCAAVRRSRRVRLWSRQGTDLTDRFSDVERTVIAQRPYDVVLDAGLVAQDGHTR